MSSTNLISHSFELCKCLLAFLNSQQAAEIRSNTWSIRAREEKSTKRSSAVPWMIV